MGEPSSPRIAEGQLAKMGDKWDQCIDCRQSGWTNDGLKRRVGLGVVVDIEMEVRAI